MTQEQIGVSWLTSDAALEVMASAIHQAMCYRGSQTPTCKGDKGDARLMLEALEKKSVFLTQITGVDYE